MKQIANKAIIEELQQQILKLQKNHAPSSEHPLQIGLGGMEDSFPGKVFTTGAVHELISNSKEEASCTNGFISVVLGKLMPLTGYCLWISAGQRRTIFPNALKVFGIDPERVLFVDAGNLKDTLWAIEEALKCNALTAVVGEVTELNFNDSRRLQLAVENSHVTGFIHRFKPKTENAVACVSRWKISPVTSSLSDAPGVGFSRWNVQLLKVRNGHTGKWQVQWSPKGLEYIVPEQITVHEINERQIG